jgi:phage shock protein PspC (stress-responsive transcriptional regulator)
MKKIININFHSRVIPIEETAYDILRKYVESLKKHFAGEEGGDEIVNDIENRFAELFSDRLKKGATCITDADVDEIINSMGHPEDFDQDEEPKINGSRKSAGSAQETVTEEPHRLYRSENDKMLGGVCGGLAAYLKIDSSFVRILFALLILGSFGSALVVYIVLWIVLPPKSLVTKIRKRLFRDPDHRMIGGVASGLAAYFNTEIWIFRLIFCAPLIVNALRSIFRHVWFDFDGPFSFLANGFGGGLFTIYIILWIVLPEAVTASEKLEMRGEKIDLESIKNTIKGDLEGFKQKATVVGAEMKQRAEQFGNEMKERSSGIRKDISSANVPRQGIGHAIGVLFKAFFLFISVIVTFALVMALIGLIFTGPVVLPLKDYLIQGIWQNIMAWSVLLFFIILPVVGLLTWLIRRIIGVRRGSNYLGYTFGSLWVIGLLSLIFLMATITRHFSNRNGVSQEIPISAPANGKLIVKIDDSKPSYMESDWMGMNWNRRGPFFDISEDSLTLNTVRVNVVKSKDSSWHLQIQKLSRGNTTAEAGHTASEINFQIDQQDSLLLLGRGFAIKPKQQFRNQQVLVVVEMPVGKKIFMNANLDDYHWFTINRKWRNNGLNIDFDDDESRYDGWDSDAEYIMTEHGLERTDRSFRSDGEQLEKPERSENPEKKEAPERKEGTDSPDKKNSNPKGDYRYHKPKTTTSAVVPVSNNDEQSINKFPETSSAVVLLSSLG